MTKDDDHLIEGPALSEELHFFGAVHAPLGSVRQSYLRELPFLDGRLGNSSQEERSQSLFPNLIRDTLLL